jgi:hypothetical protein
MLVRWTSEEGDLVGQPSKRNEQAMKTDRRNYLDLGGPSCNGFERRFSKIAIQLGLGKTLMGRELRLLYEAKSK